MSKAAVLFTNWTDEDFSHTWNKEMYDFPVGSSYYLEAGIADTFANHLVDREMNKQGIPTDHWTRPELIQKCFTQNKIIVSASQDKLNAEVMNANINSDLNKATNEVVDEPEKEVIVKKKGGRPKKEVIVQNDEVFEGLEDETAS